tara:strand:+ start:362 stop:571 length:210 start_codon:yes stop_codon:yes gene_type:complete
MDLFSAPTDTVNPFTLEAEALVDCICSVHTKDVGFRREVLYLIRSDYTKGKYLTEQGIESFAESHFNSI